jgi:hypothetical protein
MAVSLEDKASKYISKLKEIKVNTDEIMVMIKEKVLEKSGIIEIIDKEYNIASQIFDKEGLQRKINSALSSVNMEEILKEVIEQYYKPVFSKIKDYVEHYNNEVERYNSELEKMNIRKFKFPKVEFEERKVETRSVEAQFQVESADILGSVLAGIITGLAVTTALRTLAVIALEEAATASLGFTLGALAGPIGIAIGLLIGFLDITSKTEQKKEELKQKIIENIENSLYDIKQEIEKLNDIVRDAIDLIRSKFNESKFITSEIIKMLERGDLDEKIKELEAQISGLNEINKILAGG